MPKVSVTIPTYNRSRLVAEAIECVLSQTFDDLDVIVVDDGSTDDTHSVVKSINDPRVKYYYKTNGGCASARNFGIAKCTGDYVSFLDSDDLWPENFLEVMLEKLESNQECDGAYSLIEEMKPNGQKRILHQAALCKTGHITKDLFKRSFIWLQTTVFRRIVLKHLFFEESMKNGADTDALLRLSIHIQFLFVPNVQAILRIGHGVSTRQGYSSINCNRIRSLERFYFQLGGGKYVPKSIARSKLSHAYRSVAKEYYRGQHRAAARYLYRKAIIYWPLDFRLYMSLLKSYILNKKKDEMPEWKMPPPLPEIKTKISVPLATDQE